MLENNISEIFEEIKNGNNLGEQIKIVAATKTVDANTINQAIKLGINIVGDNKVQEFREKSPLINGAEFHFIGHLQKNKVKYLIGKVALIQSVDSIALAEEIDKHSKKNGVQTNILMEINIGGELSKSGFSPENAIENAKILANFENVRLLGIMAMLPKSEDEQFLAKLCLQTREIYDTIKKEVLPLDILSIGMSNDYKIAIKNGSNMIRLGTRLFGKRNIT